MFSGVSGDYIISQTRQRFRHRHRQCRRPRRHRPPDAYRAAAICRRERRSDARAQCRAARPRSTIYDDNARPRVNSLTVSIAGVTDADNATRENPTGAITGTVTYVWQVEPRPGSGIFEDIVPRPSAILRSRAPMAPASGSPPISPVSHCASRRSTQDAHGVAGDGVLADNRSVDRRTRSPPTVAGRPDGTATPAARAFISQLGPQFHSRPDQGRRSTMPTARTYSRWYPMCALRRIAHRRWLVQ